MRKNELHRTKTSTCQMGIATCASNGTPPAKPLMQSRTARGLGSSPLSAAPPRTVLFPTQLTQQISATIAQIDLALQNWQDLENQNLTTSQTQAANADSSADSSNCKNTFIKPDPCLFAELKRQLEELSILAQ